MTVLAEPQVGEPVSPAAHPPLRIVLLTGHWWGSRRRAGFHFLAEAMAAAGQDVTFATVGVSPMSWLVHDHRRLAGMGLRERPARTSADGPTTMVWSTPFHPANLRRPALNRLVTPMYRRYGRLPLGPLRAPLAAADVVVIEPGPAVLMVDTIRRINRDAVLVLRASDDLRITGAHPLLVEADHDAAARVDLVSVPSAGVAGRYEGVALPVLHRHGLRRELFDEPGPSPYRPGTVNAVFVGTNHFDHDVAERAARLFPEIDFHVIGPIPDVVERPNVHRTGEIPFEHTVPYVAHADVGLHWLRPSPHAHTFSDSLKVRQYAYCRLPILAPRSIPVDLPGVQLYDHTDESVGAAVRAALAWPRPSVHSGGVQTWSEVAESILHDALATRRAR